MDQEKPQGERPHAVLSGHEENAYRSLVSLLRVSDQVEATPEPPQSTSDVRKEGAPVPRPNVVPDVPKKEDAAAERQERFLDAQTEKDVPEILREDMARIAYARTAFKHRVVYGAASVVLLLVLGGQYVWFNSKDLFRRYPVSRPWLERLCVHTGCVLPEPRDPTRIRIVSRDVRIHPTHERALLITATLMNTASYTQPYPRMQFTLFDVNGQIIGARIFNPSEYLDEDVGLDRGMIPRTPVHIVLDVLAPEQAAVSFKFRFL